MELPSTITMTATTLLLLSWLAVVTSTADKSPFSIVSFEDSHDYIDWLCSFVEIVSHLFYSTHSLLKVIDGGSTGSRLHVFEFTDDENDVEECVRRGSSRANVPLSAFGRLPSETKTTQAQALNATYVAEHLLPLFQYAATVIPVKYHKTTPVKYQATAGMRLLEETEQKAVYDALYQGLVQAETFVFEGMQREDIATLGGDLEGFYGAVAANYLQGMIDTKLRLTSQESETQGPIGALDMGGSSTQIVYLTGGSEPTEAPLVCQAESGICESDAPPSSKSPSQLNGEDFFATSYLSYGVDQFRERLWSTLVREREKEDEQDPESCVSFFIQNPCANAGFQVEWQGFTLVGTGDTPECIQQVKRLIPHPEIPHDDHHEPRVGGVEHPPVRGKFFAMSLYFFTLDSLRHLSHANEDAHQALNLSWPNPSIGELHNALDGLCSRSWQGDLEDIQHDSHQFTRAEVLPHRCLESVYMVTLLKDGFGFHPDSRDITFTFLVDGSEVEWSLGMALALHANNQTTSTTTCEDSASDQEEKAQESNQNATHRQEESSKRAAMAHSVIPPLFFFPESL
jgi:hypothetical protein